MWTFLLCSLAVAHAEVVRHALVVGVNKGSRELDPLQYAGEDAVRIAEVLAELGGFPSDGTTLLFDPDRATLDDALIRHAEIAAASDEDLFFFYYSGHADSTGLRLGTETVSYLELTRRIEAIPAEVRLGVLDACQAGGITHAKGMVPTAPFASQEELLTVGDAWLTASAADEAAQESESLRGGFFTHYLISGLRGAADRGDGVVSLDEAYAYAYDRTVARTGTTQRGVQHPGYDFRLQGNGDLALTEVDRAGAHVVFPEEIAGVITVLQLPDETPIAEVAKRSGEPTKLGLLPGRYRLRLRDDGGVREALIGLDAGAVLNVRGFQAREADLASNRGASSENTAELDRLSNDPWVAGALSIVPGVGQAYNRQWWKGAAFLGATLAAGGTVWGPGNFQSLVASGSVGSAVPIMLWGWSIADAANVATPGRMHRPDRGWTIGGGTSTYYDRWNSRSVSFEWYPSNRIAVGLSDLGVANSVQEPNQLAYTGAVRTMVIMSRGRHWQPALVGLAGVVVQPPPDPLEDPQPDMRPPDRTTAMLGGAFDLRYYGTPRYFLELESGGRSIADEWIFTTKLGLGVHFGR